MANSYLTSETFGQDRQWFLVKCNMVTTLCMYFLPINPSIYLTNYLPINTHSPTYTFSPIYLPTYIFLHLYNLLTYLYTYLHTTYLRYLSTHLPT
jgi:hypothetical protein